MRWSLRVRLIVAFSGVAVAAIAGMVIFANLDSSRQLQNYMARGGLYGVGDLVIELEEYYTVNNSWEGVEPILTNVHQGQGTGKGNPRNSSNQLTLMDASGIVFWTSTTDYSPGEMLTEATLSTAIELMTDRNTTVGFLLTGREGAIQTSDISPFVDRINEVIIWAGVLAAITALILAVLISNRLLRPVRALTLASEQLSGGDLKTRVEVKGRDELANLGNTFNQMAENLQGAEERKQALTADIAHELRTPLAVQKAQIEGFLDGVIPVDRGNLEILANQTDFLSRMVEDLRILALADAGELKLELEQIDLNKTVKRFVDELLPQVKNGGNALLVDLSKECDKVKILADVDRLHQILHNLINNAQRYGKRNGKIVVSTKRNGEWVLVSVHDDGAGIPEEALPHLFDRFYRHEKARGRETGGSGLGLSIAKKTAQLMGGNLTAENHSATGAVFTIHLPIRNQ